MHFGNTVFLRGLIEISNHCRNNCYYCGIRRDNGAVGRYRMSKDEIMETCRLGHQLGLETFVLQGGENAGLGNRFLVDVVRSIRREFPKVAITLSMGEKSRATYQDFFDAGANRYLLRHEAASPALYAHLHPGEMELKNRIACLENLKSIGYEAGTGMMIGCPGQTIGHLVEDIGFIRSFAPRMIGMGPFIPHKDTPFAAAAPGSVEMTLLLTSIFRLMLPNVWMPATTSLATAADDGYEKGIGAGANVIMLNLTPEQYRERYTLYNNKRGAGQKVMEELDDLTKRMENIGYKLK